MKDRRFLVGVLLAFGLVTMGCENGTTPEKTTKFEGAWRSPYNNHTTYTFEEDTIVCTIGDSVPWSGTFDFTDTTITFTPTSGSPWTQNYTLSGSVLSLDTDGSHAYGTFLIQKTGATKFEGTWKNQGGSQPTYAFTNNRVVYSDNNENTWECIFIFTGSSITFTHSLSVFWTQSYTLSGNTLTIVSDSEHSYGNFQKQ